MEVLRVWEVLLLELRASHPSENAQGRDGRDELSVGSLIFTGADVPEVSEAIQSYRQEVLKILMPKKSSGESSCLG